MKTLLLFCFVLISIPSFSKEKEDTIRCGDFMAHGKIVNGKKEGVWHYKKRDRGYYSDLAEGVYHKGEKTGEWIMYSSGKQIVHYKHDQLNGTIATYDYTGKLVGQGTYARGKREGEWMYYHYNNGKTGTSSIQYYHQGIPTGTWTYFPFSDRRYSCYYGGMNAFGRNGEWIRIDSVFVDDPYHPENPYRLVQVLRDTTHYVNGAPDGTFNDVYGKGKYVNGKKEGPWLNHFSYGNEVVQYKNGLREGVDTLSYFGQYTVAFYSNDKPNGAMSFLDISGRVLAKGQAVPNPRHDFEHSTAFPIQVPLELMVDLIENGIGDSRLFQPADEYRIFNGYGSTEAPPIIFPSRDSLISQLRNSEYVTYNDSPYSMREEALSGHWIYYDQETQRKKEEGEHLPVTYDSIVWDSTNQMEDPNNPGTYILVPLRTEMPIYSKTGWWNYYNSDEVLIRQEHYDENGKLLETKDTLGLGYHINYWQNGNKREEGLLTPIKYETELWDSTNQEEDPRNPGTYILVPKLIQRPAYYKSGWWKIYNEEGQLLREEQYDQYIYGAVIGVREYDANGNLIRTYTYDRWGEMLDQKEY